MFALALNKMSKSPRLRGPKLHEECYTISPLHPHSFLNSKNNFDVKLVLAYCALRGIKPPTEEIKDFNDLHVLAKQTVINININILSEKKALEGGKQKKTKSEKKNDDGSSVKSEKSEKMKITKIHKKTSPKKK